VFAFYYIIAFGKAGKDEDSAEDMIFFAEISGKFQGALMLILGIALIVITTLLARALKTETSLNG
jgi:hypothetical protein